MGLPMYRVGTGATALRRRRRRSRRPTRRPDCRSHRSASRRASTGSTPRSALLRLGRRVRREPPPDRADTKLDVTQPGLVAHGALITGLASTDEPNFDAAFSRVVDDLSAFFARARRGRHVPDEAAVDRFAGATPLGTRQRLTLFSGQFRATAPRRRSGIGTRGGSLHSRATSSIRLQATRTSPFDLRPGQVTRAGGTVGFAVDVTDDVGGAKRGASSPSTEMPVGSGSASRCRTARPAGAAQAVGWHRRRVAHPGGRQAATSVTANKAVGKTVLQPEPTGDIQAEATGPQTNGWYTGDPDPTVTISGAPASRTASTAHRSRRAPR